MILIILTGFGKNKIDVLGYVCAIIKIGEDEFPSTIYVVKNKAMNVDAVVGSDVLSSS